MRRKKSKSSHFKIYLGLQNLKEETWLCGNQCQPLITPCNGSCAHDNLKINCNGTCEDPEYPNFYKCSNECLHISKTCNRECLYETLTLNCDGTCEENPATYICNGQCLQSHQMCNNTCPVYKYQKCINEDVCINLDVQCKIVRGSKIENNPLKNCLAEKYNLQQLCSEKLKIENNTLKPRDRR